MISDHDGQRRQPAQDPGMHDLGRDRRPMDACGRRTGFHRPYRRGAGCGAERAYLPADQRQSFGFNKPANPNAIGTLEEAINKIKALPVKPAFVIHTGDITHLSKPDEFDDADQSSRRVSLDVHYVPGEHDFIDDAGKAYLDRYGKGTKGAGWYSFDDNGVHFIGLVNVVDLKAGGLGNLGDEQLDWLEDDLKGRSASTPDRRLRAYSVVDRLSALGLGHRGRRARARLSQAFRLGDGAQRPHPSDHAEGRRQRDLSHRHVDRLPAAGAGRGTLAGTDESP